MILMILEYKTVFSWSVVLEFHFSISISTWWVTWLWKIINKSRGVDFQTLFLFRFWIRVTRAFQRYATCPCFDEKNQNMTSHLIWRHNVFLQNIIMLHTVGKLSLLWFRIAIETGSENDFLKACDHVKIAVHFCF